jgi:peptidyl-tRNA hydrolase, PTH1 family
MHGVPGEEDRLRSSPERDRDIGTMKIVVGLGNPGPEYRNTRHNVGFDVVAELARRFDGSRPTIKHQAELVEIRVGGEKVLLVAPMTYMNLSGRSVQPLVAFYQTEPGDLMVVCDDMNLDRGRVRLKPGGSAGGQKGLADILQRLGVDEIPRTRIGIGRPPGRMQATDYVLGKLKGQEMEEVERAILLAADGLETWVREGLDAAMNQVNAPQ